MGKISVIVVDATGNKEQKVGLPDDIKIGVIMVKLVEKIKLPLTGPDGNPISYKFIHKVSGKQLLETQTMAEAGVKDGDVLRLQPEITAGAFCPKCGGEIPPGAGNCPRCGHSLGSQAINPALNKKSKPELIRMLGIAGVLAQTGANLLTNLLDYKESLFKLLYAVSSLGNGAFLLAVVLYLIYKTEK